MVPAWNTTVPPVTSAVTFLFPLLPATKPAFAAIADDPNDSAASSRAGARIDRVTVSSFGPRFSRRRTRARPPADRVLAHRGHGFLDDPRREEDEKLRLLDVLARLLEGVTE